MPEVLNIKEQVAISVSLAEGQFREFKTAYAGPPGQKVKRPVRDICKDVSEALVAFANADGGELLIGVEDDGELTGTNDFSDLEIAGIKAAPTSHIHPDTPLQSVIVRDVEVDGKRVLYFRVPKGTRQIHLTSDGRCLKRNDLESVPVAAERIQFDRAEVVSREYDREFVDGASVADLDPNLLRIVADQVSPGISVDRCLQYLGLAEYDVMTGMRLRRAALLLFASNPDKWHPRVQVRILKVSGTSLGTGADYNATDDITVKANVVKLLDEAWDQLRPYLVATRFQEDARFRTTYIYPEVACREALVNAIAHRDYSEEGRGIEIYIYDDRIEVQNPGQLLSSISLDDITSLRGAHQSRNSYVARSLREIGVMRELGEGMRRIYELMKSSELAPPEIKTESSTFTLGLHHSPMYNKDEVLWLSQFDGLELSAEEKSVILLGRKGDLITPNDIIKRVGIVDIEHYRQIVHSLQTKGVLGSGISREDAQRAAKRQGVGRRDVARFKVLSRKELSPSATSILEPIDLSGPAEIESKSIYVGNIPPNTGQRDIISAFARIGSPTSVHIPMSGGLSRGFAFVDFESTEVAAAAMASPPSLGGRRLVLRWKRPRTRG